VEFAKSFILSHRKNNVLTAIKHFPGHGSTPLDSHLSLPDISSVWRKQELQPFAELINAGLADMVMVGHLVHRNVTGSGLPATLSPKAINGLLRGKLGYDGVIVSDDMQMGALRNHFSPEEAIVLGVEAGLDLFIYSNREHPDPQMPELFHRVVKSAIETGRIAPGRIGESARRILALKSRLYAAL
jgi:beta-N-acetylhexosaminidase